MSQLSVKIEGLEEAQELLRNYPTRAREEFGRAIKNSVLGVQRQARKNAPASEGQLRATIHEKHNDTEGEVFSGVKYGIFVHEGTKPHWPPFHEGSSLATWSRRKGIPPFLVARKISQRGTKAQPFLKNAVESMTNNIQKFFKEAMERIFQ